MPESLYSIFLHEFGHAIDPVTISETEALFNGNPFQKELQCLQRSDSVGAQKSDIQCVNNIFNKYKESDKTKAEDASTYSKAMSMYPHHAFEMPELEPDSSLCKQNQINEAFADWMSSEVFVQSFKSISQSAADETSFIQKQKNGETTIDIQKRLSLLPELQMTLAYYCTDEKNIEEARNNNTGTHPLNEDRINKILTAHPLVKYALGCSAEYRNNLKDINDPLTQKGSAYCGQNLYSSKEKGQE